MSKSIREGDKIPSFRLLDHEGQPVEISAGLGKPLVIYFYPKDDTPGCTQEACSFRDSHEAFIEAGVAVYGISSDDVASHARFREKHNLPFTLLSDQGGEVRKRFGVPTNMFGLIPGRVTYVVDPEGIVRKVINSQMQTHKHIDQALATIGSFPK